MTNAQMPEPLHHADAYTDNSDTGATGDSSVNSVYKPAIVLLEPDLFFSTRLVDVVRGQGARPVLVETSGALVEAVDRHFPVLTLVDLQTEGDWASAIQRIKMRPHSSPVPIYAFGSHVDVETLRRARQAGADHVWARSKMMESLVDLVGSHVRPPVRYPTGWDEPLSDLARRGVELFNAGEYYEQHDLFEAAWMEEERPIRDLYQGILQVGVAIFQIERGNWAGAVKMLRRGLPRLRDLPPICRGLRLDPFRAQMEAIHVDVSEGGPDALADFDFSRVPKLTFTQE